ncbi:predicted protein [Nematostella vectensis]|uniref:G-protein coupled receptors family 1 profile domain-containing protein n=1 Tax=Nematostella vectensis TaxID=45351 RepID=A7S7D0_NEMVE|nr:histamine H2 receptor-like [Nematostella vectensis]EDO40402.1 predicted protein [Nematostella vectensis]|eukprot:XP_001632465.1 predicted protein [Nematostella vectensis]
MMNIIAIGIERYFGIFRPLSSPAEETAKRLVIAAWITGILMTVVPNINMKRRRYYIDDDKYTLFCSYDNSTPTSRIINTVFSVLVYYMPCILLSILCVRILRFLKRRRQVDAGQSSSSITNTPRFQGSYMLVSLIFAFILPYLVYVVYFTAMMILQPPVSYVTDFTIRYAAAAAGYANGALNPAIYLIAMQNARVRLKGLFTGRRLAEPAIETHPTRRTTNQGSRDPRSNPHVIIDKDTSADQLALKTCQGENIFSLQ